MDPKYTEEEVALKGARQWKGYIVSLVAKGHLMENVLYLGIWILNLIWSVTVTFV